jgi:hypothetical protein
LEDLANCPLVALRHWLIAYLISLAPYA